MIKERKQETTPEELCDGLPEEMTEIAMHIRSLGFQDTPDYAQMLSSLRKCLFRLNLKEGEISFPKDEK